MVSIIAPARNLVRQTSKRFLKSRKAGEGSKKKSLQGRRRSTDLKKDEEQQQQQQEQQHEDHTSTTMEGSSKQLSMNEDGYKIDVTTDAAQKVESQAKEERPKETKNEDTFEETQQPNLFEEFQRAIPQAQDDNTFVTDDDCSSIFDSMSLYSIVDDGSLGIHDGDDKAEDEDETEVSFHFDMGPVLAQSRPRPRMVRLRGSRNVAALGNDFVQEERNRLKTKIQQSIEVMTEEEAEIRKSLRSHLDKAKARHDNQNTKGALLSMQKAHKIHEDQESLLAAIGSLRILEAQVDNPKKSLVSSRKGGSLEITVDNGSLDLAHQKEHFERILQDHQNHEARHTTLTDKQLVQKLLKLTTRTELGHSGHSTRSLGAPSPRKEARRFLKRGGRKEEEHHVDCTEDSDNHSFRSLDM